MSKNKTLSVSTVKNAKNDTFKMHVPTRGGARWCAK